MSGIEVGIVRLGRDVVLLGRREDEELRLGNGGGADEIGG